MQIVLKQDLEELLERFENGFPYSNSIEAKFQPLTDPSAVEISSDLEFPYPELIKLQDSSILRTRHPESTLIEFFCLPLVPPSPPKIPNGARR